MINLKDEEARELEVVARLLLGRNAVVCGFQFEYVWRKHEHRREGLILWPRTGGHEAKALQDGRSAAWIGLILGSKCLLITERYLPSFGQGSWARHHRLLRSRAAAQMVKRMVNLARGSS